MAEDTQRRVTLERLDTGVYRATNARGNQLQFGSYDDTGFSPVELLLAAVGGCAAVDVDVVTSRRAEPDRFEIAVEAQKVTDDDGNILQDITMSFDIQFPAGPDGDKARDRVPSAIRHSHDRTCTVSRTLEAPSPVITRIIDHA